jgi:esterase/lipase superfamily enzyme/nucleoid DNA-binding protein
VAGKAALVAAVYERVEGLTKQKAAAIVEAIFTAIQEALSRGETVTIPGFGRFAVARREAREGRNPRTGNAIRIPRYLTVRFRSLSDLEEVPKDAAPRHPEGGETEDLLVDWVERARQARRSWRSGSQGYGGGSGGPGAPPPDSDQDMPGEPPAEPTVEPVGRAARGEQPGRYHVVEVYYATDRKATDSQEPARRYGSGRGDGSLEYGVCEVSIPEDHRIGSLEGPSWHRFELRADPEKHVVLLGVTSAPKDRFFTELAATLRSSSRNQILVFLHGFKVSFEDAARRTAQMAYDLEFEGAPVFYSWPSKGALAAYAQDEATVEWTVPHLKGFLEDLASRSGAEAIHLIAHSMGNRALTRALEQLAAVMADRDAPRFSEVVLTAPDIDAGVFLQTAAAFRRAAGRVTLYASEKDKALLASHKVHGYPRAGDGGANIVVVPGVVDTIDASAVDTNLIGHFYYGDNRSVLSDVFYLLRDGKPASQRFGLKARRCKAGAYWAFVP